MLPPHIRWSSIELLHNVVRTLEYLKEQGHALPHVRYRAKIKLHGSNAGVQVTPDGVFAQSRSKMLTPQKDYKGFARWVSENAAFFEAIAPGTTVFGEWCGPGIEPGMAISAVDRKVFAIFALQLGRGDGAQILYDPEQIAARLGTCPDVHVLPWQGEPLALDYASPHDLEQKAEVINASIAQVEAEDPWVKQVFGASGLGEGLVFYPVGDSATPDAEVLSRLMFKAKGLKHRTVAQKAARPKATVAAGVPELVALVVTEARLAQGVREACGGELNMRHTGTFLRWVTADTRKESVAELEAAGLTWEQVQKAVQTRARAWFKAKVLSA